MAAANPNIKHVFVLMLENRSFDHMLGFLKMSGTDAETGKPTITNHLKGTEFNLFDGKKCVVKKDATFIMGKDPKHEFEDVLEQLTGRTVYHGGPYPPVSNEGFVTNFAGTGSKTPGEIMQCYDTEVHLPVMTALAREFAVCDQWYSSLPGPTWPNRFFVHAASSGGLDNSPRKRDTALWLLASGFEFKNGTIFDSLTRAGHSWRIYRGKKRPLEGSIPSVAALKGIHLRDTHAYENFAKDLDNNYSYAYTFIEPNYGHILNNSYSDGQSQHPMDDVRNGEELIRCTYESIRKSTIWLNSLLIITYDEHGGFFDHASPQAAIPPGDTLPFNKYNKTGFGFDQYGVRVPALVVSAYTAKNQISHLPYDHSSVPATLEEMFQLSALTDRDAKAHTVCSLASLSEARADTPASLPKPAPTTPATEFKLIERNVNVAPDTASVDEGNLPGFLFVVQKAQIEQEPLENNKFLLLVQSTEGLNTRGEARAYIESTLPGLLQNN